MGAKKSHQYTYPRQHFIIFFLFFLYIKTKFLYFLSRFYPRRSSFTGNLISTRGSLASGAAESAALAQQQSPPSALFYITCARVPYTHILHSTTTIFLLLYILFKGATKNISEKLTGSIETGTQRDAGLVALHIRPSQGYNRRVCTQQRLLESDLITFIALSAIWWWYKKVTKEVLKIYFPPEFFHPLWYQSQQQQPQSLV